jgi:hypothetical protein
MTELISFSLWMDLRLDYKNERVSRMKGMKGLAVFAVVCIAVSLACIGLVIEGSIFVAGYWGKSIDLSSLEMITCSLYPLITGKGHVSFSMKVVSSSPSLMLSWRSASSIACPDLVISEEGIAQSAACDLHGSATLYIISPITFSFENASSCVDEYGEGAVDASEGTVSVTGSSTTSYPCSLFSAIIPLIIGACGVIAVALIFVPLLVIVAMDKARKWRASHGMKRPTMPCLAGQTPTILRVAELRSTMPCLAGQSPTILCVTEQSSTMPCVAGQSPTIHVMEPSSEGVVRV